MTKKRLPKSAGIHGGVFDVNFSNGHKPNYFAEFNENLFKQKEEDLIPLDSPKHAKQRGLQVKADAIRKDRIQCQKKKAQCDSQSQNFRIIIS